MKVGIFFPHLDPESGGAFTFAETVLSGLSAFGNSDEITVFHYGPKIATPAQLSDRVRYRNLGGTGFFRSLRRAYYMAVGARFQRFEFRILRKLGIPFPYPCASSLDRATRSSGIEFMLFPTPAYEPVECPYAITVWDLEHRAQPYFPEVSARGEWNGREEYFRSALSRASYVITGTEVGKREIVQFFGVVPERVRLLPHPTPSFALEATAKLTLPSKFGVKTPYVFYPAQFWAHKNHATLVDAIATLQADGSPVDCVLVGSDKGGKSHIQNLACAAKAEARVHFLGFVSREELIALYQNALALVYPSLCGPENLPPLEAMALGCPVIASDIMGAREQLGTAAKLVNGLDSAAIAKAIADLRSSDGERTRLIESGKARSLRYRDQEFAADLANILSEFRKIRRLWA